MRQHRGRRSGVEDLWWMDERDADGKIKRGEDGSARRVPTKLHGKGKRWRARYVDDVENEHTRRFTRKTDAQDWIDTQVSTLVQGTHVAPRDQQRTVDEWCAEWFEGYAKRQGTVDTAKSHIREIKAEFGSLTLSAIRPSMVKTWIAKLKKRGLSDSYVYVLHRRLSQLLGDAVEDGLLGRNPCSDKTSPPAGKQKVYVATTDQVWALHDAFPKPARVAILLGAFVGLRISEASGLKISDVDFVRGIVHMRQQWNDADLKTDGSDASIPIPRELTLLFSAAVKEFPGDNLVCDEFGQPYGPWTLGRFMRDARATIPGLPEGFTFQDLRHYYASLLISKGADVKIVQARMRHASAVTTLNVYSHLWPDSDESTRTAVGEVLRERSAAYSLRTRSRRTRKA